MEASSGVTNTRVKTTQEGQLIEKKLTEIEKEIKEIAEKAISQAPVTVPKFDDTCTHEQLWGY